MTKRLATLLMFLLLLPAVLYAQSDYPSRPVKLIVPFSPGGPSDTLARTFGMEMEKRLKQPFVIENRPGGLTLIGVNVVVNSPADGHTLLVTSGSVLASEQVANPDWPVRVERDLTPISVFAGSGFAIVVTSNLPLKSMRELVDYSRANPGRLNQAQAGTIAVEIELLKQRLHMGSVENVIYKSGPLAVQAIASGEAQFYAAAVPDVVQLEKAGKLKIILYTEGSRHPQIPHVPTPREAGLGIDDYVSGFWFVLMGPAKLPLEVTNKLSATTAEMVKSPGFTERAMAFGMEPYAYTPEQTVARITATIKALTEAKNAGVRLR